MGADKGDHVNKPVNVIAKYPEYEETKIVILSFTDPNAELSKLGPGWKLLEMKEILDVPKEKA